MKRSDSLKKYYLLKAKCYMKHFTCIMSYYMHLTQRDCPQEPYEIDVSLTYKGMKLKVTSRTKIEPRLKM